MASRIRLEIRDFRSQVHLGVPADERARPQDVSFDIRIGYALEPRGTTTDRIEDTLCYATLCQVIASTARKRPYQLVESLARSVYEVLKEQAGPGHAIEVTVHKLRPPVENLHGGVRFTYGDEVP